MMAYGALLAFVLDATAPEPTKDKAGRQDKAIYFYSSTQFPVALYTTSRVRVLSISDFEENISNR